MINIDQTLRITRSKMPSSKKQSARSSSSKKETSRPKETQKKVRPLGSKTLEKESEEVLEDEVEGKEEFEKENP